jgi:hypothetical protein
MSYKTGLFYLLAIVLFLVPSVALGAWLFFNQAAAPENAVRPPWWPLLSLIGTAELGALLLVCSVCVRWRNSQGQVDLLKELTGLGTGWSFRDQWAGNLTWIGTLLAGFFANSSILDSIGVNADNVIAVVLVASTIASCLVGAGPLLIAATARNGVVTAFGLLVAATVTLGATAGQLAVVAMASTNLALSGAQVWFSAVGVLGSIVLGCYGVTVLSWNLGADNAAISAKQIALSADMQRSAAAITAEVGQPGSMQGANVTLFPVWEPPDRRRSALL